MLSTFLFSMTIVAVGLLGGHFLFNNFPPLDGLIPVNSVLA